MGDIEEAFEEATSTNIAKKVKTIPYNIPTNVSYMNRGKWKYDGSIRNAYVWRSQKGSIELGFEEHRCRILVKGKDTKRVDVENITEGFIVVEDILARY